MLNIIIISDEAKNIAACSKPQVLRPIPRTQKGRAFRLRAESHHGKTMTSPFLDLDTENWQERLLDARHSMPVIAFSHPDLHKAVEALKLGAGDYLAKPLTADVLSEVIGRHKKQILSNKYGFDEIIGNSAPMQEVFGLIKKAAASESNVLITGESGTGKELIARAIHRWSPRSEKSFTTINCTAIPDTLLESELFGFEKGSFTGAQYTKKGLLEQADGGTVFFDEIGDVSPLFQTKVLRVLQEGEIMRNRRHAPDPRGPPVHHGHEPRPQDRVPARYFPGRPFLPSQRHQYPSTAIAGTDGGCCASGKALCPEARAQAEGRPDQVHQRRGFEPSAGASLSRERAGAREHHRAFDLLREHLPRSFLADLPPNLRQAPAPAKHRASAQRLKDALTAVEKETITAALLESGGNISRAATLLGIYRQQLQRKIKQHKIAV